MFVQLGNVLVNTDRLIAIVKQPDCATAHITLDGKDSVKAIATEQEVKSLYERLSSSADFRGTGSGETR